MTLLIYLIKTILISGLLYGYFMLVLRNRPFHAFNRFFLLSIPLISMMLPLLHVSLPAFWNRRLTGPPVHLLGVSHGNWEEVFTIYADQQKTNILTWPFMGIFICAAISVFFLVRLGMSVLYLQKLKLKSPKQILPLATLYFVSEKGTPFSFFRSIFWSENMNPDQEPGRQILRHELFHVQHRHSWDTLFLELFSAVCWFNPWFYGISRELKAIHEYGADEYAAGDSDRYAYAGLLLSHISGNTFSFTHPFFKNQIKRRIIMMTKQKKKAGWYGRLFLLPLLLVIATLFSFRFQNISPKKTIRVVIDAGHGGVFSGSRFQDVQEKNVNLSIAKKIKSLSASYNVEVIMSRDEDVSPGSNELSESLKYVSSLAEQKNADLFISIHVNASISGNAGTGFDIYVPQNSNKEYKGSVLLGTTIAEKIKKDYQTSADLKQRSQGVWILDKATVPAVLIECGYLDNPADLKFITDEKNQEKIAQDILEGVRQYATHQAASSNPDQTETMSYETMLKLPSAETEKMDINAKDGYIIVHLKNGKKAFVQVPDAVKNEWTGKTNRINADTPVFDKVEVEAQFPGGQQGWYDYLVKTLKYPSDAVKKEIQGTVVVEFIVKINGTVSDVKAISGPEALKAEAVRAIKESGKWIPAKNNGAIVESYKKQPFNFKLS